MKSLSKNTPYRKFINDRDYVLEDLLNRSKLRVTDIGRKYFSDILTAISVNYEKLQMPGMMVAMDQVLDNIFFNFTKDIVKEYKHLRKLTYLFTLMTDTEAIARATGQTLEFKINKDKLNEFINQDAASGGSLDQRISHALTRLKYKISQTISLGLISGDERTALIQRVFDSFPKIQTIKKKKILKRISTKEADQRKIAQRVSVGFIDDQDWKEIVDAYKEEYVPKWRGPETSFDVEPGYPVYKHLDDTEAIYAWEIERDMTHDFVQAVRMGMVDSAKQQGIEDFMVIAIVDDKICDNCCGDFGCIDFDGKTTKEIEEMTKGAQSIPPFHFNCATSGHSILTNNGQKLIEEIKIGDKVLTHKNRFKEVTATLQTRTKSILKITLSNGKTLEVTEDHPFFHNGKWASAKDLNVGCDLILFDDANSCDILNKDNEEILNHEIDKFSKVDHGE